MTEDGETWNFEGLLTRLGVAHTKAKNEYIALLFEGNYVAAAKKLTEADLIEMHIDRVGSL